LNTTLTKSGLTAIISSKGAELISLRKTETGREYIWEGNPEFWGKHSPVLFPIVGTLKRNSYSYKGKNYHLSRHGFARDMMFELTEHAENYAVFSLIANDATLAVYPFRFELQLIYELDADGLYVTYKVINNENFEMPFSIGGHPAFALQQNFENYNLEFKQDDALISYQLQDDLLSDVTTQLQLHDKKLQLNYALFEKDALIFKKMNSKTITLLENNHALLNFHFADFAHFGIWTKENAPFICLEPWLGFSDTLTSTGAIEEKEAIQILQSNSAIKFTFRIEIL